MSVQLNQMKSRPKDAADRTVKISVKNLYKIFGDAPETMVDLVRSGVSKTELLEKHQHVLGLNDINIDMMDGEITVIMGLSGSGKSTLIRHLNRLIEPTAGEVILDGEDVLQLPEAELLQLRRKRMSMVFQKFALFPHRTVSENASLALDVRGDHPPSTRGVLHGDREAMNDRALKLAKILHSLRPEKARRCRHESFRRPPARQGRRNRVVIPD